jgi:hypothetical protein
MEGDLNIMKMEDNLNFSENGRQTHFYNLFIGGRIDSAMMQCHLSKRYLSTYFL